MIFENLPTCLAKISVMKFEQIKNLRCTFSLFFHAYCHEIFFTCYIRLFLVENWPRKWSIFMFLIISWLLKISQHVSQKSLWWSFKNKKSEMYIFFVFPCLSSWDIFVCNILLFLMENWPRKWAIFEFFIISWYLKISQYVFHKSVWSF